MKNTLLLTFLMVLGLSCFAQTPTTFNYQSVLRDANGQVLANQDVEIGITILQGSATGSEVFAETHSVTTNSFGLVNLQIGSVNPTDMQTIDWSAGPYFIQISVDGTIMGTSQLLSVPYAIHAQTVENDAVDDADADPANELQQLALENNELSISDGNSVDLSSLINTKDTSVSNEIQQLNLNGEQLAITGGNSVDLSTLLNTKDTSATNELQDISLAGTNLSISDGSTVDLSDLLDSTDNQKLQFYSGTRYLSISDGNSVYLPFIITEKDGDPTNELQELSISNDTIFLTDGGFVELPDETDPIYAADSLLLKTAANEWNSSVAKGITEADTTAWNQDTLATNEIQTLTISNDTIFLSDGGNVKLPTETDPVYAADSLLLKTAASEWNSSVAKGITDADTAAWNQDTLATNEIQTLTISNDTIFLSNGGNVKLPAASYGYVYNQSPGISILANADVPFSNNGPLSGITHTEGNTSVTVSIAGVYKIDYSVNINPATPGASIAIAANGSIEPSTIVTSVVSTGQVMGSAMLDLDAGSTITLRNSGPIDIIVVGAQINLTRLGDQINQ